MGENFIDESDRWAHWATMMAAAIASVAAILFKPLNKIRLARKEKAEREKINTENLAYIRTTIDRNTWITLQGLNLTGARVFESNLKGECIWVSYEWANLTGYSLSEAQGFGWTMAVCERDLPRVLAAWKESYENLRPFLCRYHYCRKDRTRVHVEVRGTLMKTPEGKPIGYFGHVNPDPIDETRNGGKSDSGTSVTGNAMGRIDSTDRARDSGS